jgi:hypothetical protein
MLLKRDLFSRQLTTNYQQSLSSPLGNEHNIQKLDVNIGEMGPDCDVILGQKIDASSQSSASMEPQTINQAKTEVETELTAAAAAAMEKVTEAGNMQFGDRQDMEQEVNMAIKNVIKNTFETNSLNEVISEMVNMQDGRLNIMKCNGKIDFQQNIVAQLMAEAITKSLTTNITDNSVLNSLHAAVSGEQKTENKGLSDLVNSIGNAISGPLKYGIIASVICCCLIVIGATLFLLSPAGQNAAKTGASVAAKRF